MGESIKNLTRVSAIAWEIIYCRLEIRTAWYVLTALKETGGYGVW